MIDRMEVEKVKPLTNEDYESLLALYGSPHWKRYAALLNQRMVAKMFTALPMKTGEEALKTLGEIAGLNEAINLLRTLADEHERKQRLREAVEYQIKK